MTQIAPDTDGFLRGEFPFTDKDFAAISGYAQRHFGICLPETKKQLVYSRLARRLRRLGLRDFKSYIALLEGPRASQEHTELLSALATNTTHFFREQHHFDTLATEVLPRAAAASRSGPARIRLWSAGCSTGQEPYSLAMTVLDALPDVARHDVKILATDIVPSVVARARTARYSAEEIASIPEDRRSRFVEETADGSFTFVPEVRRLVTFGELNLIEPLPFKGPFDAVFCRNVAIYFDKSVQAHVWSNLASVLAPEGYLFIGHSERLSGPVEQDFKSSGITTYRNVRPGFPCQDEPRRRSA